MVVFAVKVKPNKVLKEYVSFVNEMLRNPGFQVNLFDSDSYVKYSKEKKWLVFNMNHFIPNHYPLVFLAWFAVIFLGGFELSWWLVLPLFLTALLFFHTKYFFYLMAKAGLKKQGYTGEYELVKQEEFIKVAVTGWLREK